MIHNYIDISLIESYVPTVSHFHCDYKHLSCPCYVGLSIQDVNCNQIIINFSHSQECCNYTVEIQGQVFTRPYRKHFNFEGF